MTYPYDYPDLSWFIPLVGGCSHMSARICWFLTWPQLIHSHDQSCRDFGAGSGDPYPSTSPLIAHVLQVLQFFGPCKYTTMGHSPHWTYLTMLKVQRFEDSSVWDLCCHVQHPSKTWGHCKVPLNSRRYASSHFLLQQQNLNLELNAESYCHKPPKTQQ